jgi:integrase
MKGTGGLYLRGSIWWIRFSHRGVEYRESSESTSETVARKLLSARIKETGRRGKFLGPAEERLTFEDLAATITSDYAVNAFRSTRRVEGALKHLRAYFGLDRAVDITTDRVRAYVVKRREAGAASATVNRELAALKRAFAIAVKDERLSRAPHIEMLDESGNARQGFLEHAEFVALRDVLPEYLRDPITFLYLSGWRVSEMKSLEWKDVDADGGMIRLAPEKSKTKEGRTLPISGELAEVMARAHAARRLECAAVFHHDGQPILDFRGSWAAGASKAGLGHLLVHDLRRCAIRNLVRAGVSDHVAMKLSGHKTRAIFDRYNITSEADLKAATERRDSYLSGRPTERKIVPLTGQK